MNAELKVIRTAAEQALIAALPDCQGIAARGRGGGAPA